ncbi:TonB-dependent receptor plug domain-containing protein [Sphingobium sp. BYY-5]|uniref:TonB-dependent receptor n=1 Tax=Sphingobium sp. BYY-5 TaxID=2926400 RepID=UPI001FA80616|nr:TonB-dependent receptor [Sphingobium sp. BYY-5]MCI4592062.1 TonB-dependent receptor plug domain-containing protein [Sphingobium sp. BYY-5]
MKAFHAAHLGVSLTAMLVATPLLAQPATPEPESARAPIMADIIVQARRREEDVQDVPGVIDAVTAAQIDKLNLRSFNDVQALVPGLELSSNANGIGANAKLRGINFDINASGNNPTVEFYFNDAPITAGAIIQQMYDIGQIEVQRGPQGTLRGRASPSGSITVSARKPDLYGYGAYVDLTANDIGTMNAKGAVNIPIIEGVLGLRAAGVWDENEGDRVRAAHNPDPRSTTTSGRISAIAKPIDWLSFEGTYQYLKRNAQSYDQAISFSEANPDAVPSPIRITAEDRLSLQERPRPIHQRFDIYNWRAEAGQIGQRLIYQGQHYTQKLYSADNFDDAIFFPGSVVDQVTHTRAKATSHEIRLQNEERVFDFLDYVVGVFDYKNRSQTNLTTPTVVRLPVIFGGGVAQIVNTPISRPTDEHERSFFGNLTAHISRNTEISGGLRRIDYNFTGNFSVGGQVIDAQERDEGKLIYNASVKHNFTPDFMVYASTGSSWRPGLTAIGDFNLAPSALEKSFVHVPPESSKSYEIGFKSTLLGGRAQFNLTAYHQKFKNFPYRSPTGVFYVNTVAVTDASGSVTGVSQQVGQFNFVAPVPVEVNGVEADFNVAIGSRLNIGANASYSLGKIKDGVIACNDLNGDGIPDVTTGTPSLAALQAAVGTDNLSTCRTNQRSAFLSPASATLQTEYRIPVSTATESYLRGLFSYSGKSQGDPTNPFDDVRDYGLLNLYAGFRGKDGMWEISFFAKNIFNTTKVSARTNPYFTSYQQLGFAGQFNNGVPVFTGPTGASATSTYTGGTLTPPREFGVNLRFAFGTR